MKELRIAIVGHRFMGRAHSNAWNQVSRFFDPALKPVMQVACGRDEKDLRAFADRWGWAEIETDWRKVLERDDIDAIDIATPTFLHAEMAIAAAEAGKHIFCEKPFCNSLTEAEAMLAAAEKAGVVHYLNHNYRRCPAVLLAKKLIDEGEIGEIYHWRGAYQQSWLVNPQHPLDWKLQKRTAAAGPLWDLGSHAVDLAHFLVGDFAEIDCRGKQFIAKRPLASDPSKIGDVEVECAALMTGEFQNGALATIETTRYATGRRNRHTFEIYGSKGAIIWDMEDMNRLQFYSGNDPADRLGFRDILVTESSHAYVGAWWPPGHIIGYEHAFVHAAVDFLNAVGAGTQVEPNFQDGVKSIKVLEAAAKSMEIGQRVRIE
ncbi:MAG TPA: Gfo/Idh/MocA family oxidoreductase [Verrucomicrobiales bacterium]|nr:Gfo/Idh/MocA family oxidoreductase [Verrucomicrobiales bacterium]